MSRNRVMLTNYKRKMDVDSLNPVLITAEYLASNQKEGTTLEQTLVLVQDAYGGWTAATHFDSFPPQETAGAAALKLAEWLERMAEAIRVGDYQLPEVGPYVERKEP